MKQLQGLSLRFPLHKGGLSVKDEKIQELLKVYKELMPEGVVLVKNKERYEEVRSIIQEISDFAWDVCESAEIDIRPDELTGASICMEVVTDLFVVDHMDKFCEALKKANNFEIYPRTDGRVGLGLVFKKVFSPAPPIKSK